MYEVPSNPDVGPGPDHPRGRAGERQPDDRAAQHRAAARHPRTTARRSRPEPAAVFSIVAGRPDRPSSGARPTTAAAGPARGRSALGVTVASQLVGVPGARCLPARPARRRRRRPTWSGAPAPGWPAFSASCCSTAGCPTGAMAVVAPDHRGDRGAWYRMVGRPGSGRGAVAAGPGRRGLRRGRHRAGQPRARRTGRRPGHAAGDRARARLPARCSGCSSSCSPRPRPTSGLWPIVAGRGSARSRSACVAGAYGAAPRCGCLGPALGWVAAGRHRRHAANALYLLAIAGRAAERGGADRRAVPGQHRAARARPGQGTAAPGPGRRAGPGRHRAGPHRDLTACVRLDPRYWPAYAVWP